MKTNGVHAGMDAGVEATRLDWSSGAGAAGAGLVRWCRGSWGFHHIFGSPELPIASPPTHTYIHIHVVILLYGNNNHDEFIVIYFHESSS
jgi:hypothetical protein